MSFFVQHFREEPGYRSQYAARLWTRWSRVRIPAETKIYLLYRGKWARVWGRPLISI